MLQFQTTSNDAAFFHPHEVVCVQECSDHPRGPTATITLRGGLTISVWDADRRARTALSPSIPDHDPNPPGDIHRLLQAADQLAHAVLEHLRPQENGNPALIGLARVLEAEVLAVTKPKPDKPMPESIADCESDADVDRYIAKLHENDHA